MANAKDITTGSLKILLYGPAGTKKTTLASTFPDPHFIDLDNGMKVVRGKDIKYITINGRITEDADFNTIFGKEAEKMVKQSAFVKAQKLAEHWANTLTPQQTLVIDSLSFWANYAMDHVLALAGRTGGAPQLQDYGAARKLIEVSIEALKSSSCNLIIITHEDFEKDEEQGFISFIPKGVTGNQGRMLPTFFDEVWRASVKHGKGVDAGKLTYQIETVAARRAEGKSRLNLPPVIEEPTYEKIKSFIK